MFSGKTFKAKKAYKLPLLVTLPFPRIWIKIKLNEVQLKPMGKLEWDFFFGTEEVVVLGLDCTEEMVCLQLRVAQ